MGIWERAVFQSLRKGDKEREEKEEEEEQEANFRMAEGWWPQGDEAEERALVSGVILCRFPSFFILWFVFSCQGPTNIFGRIFHILEFIGGILEIKGEIGFSVN